MSSQEKRKITFIINPKSGRRLWSLKKERILKHLDTKNLSPEFLITEYPGHAKELAFEAVKGGCEIIVAVGGDGTVNEVAATLVNLEASLAILPSGSGNGLARHLKIPMQWSKAIKIIEAGNKKIIDGGTLNDSWFFCTCGIGFDARIGHKFTKINKRGFAAYLKTAVEEYTGYKPRKYAFSVDDEKFVRKAFVITVANASQYGNNAYIAPDALIDDGLFDVCIIKPFPFHKGLSLGMKLFNRSIQYSKYHEVVRGKTIKFKKPKKKYRFHYDGEAVKFGKEKIVIEMHPKTLSVIVP
jgi:YegS/Rv2252/BmrU family lipid kinase